MCNHAFQYLDGRKITSRRREGLVKSNCQKFREVNTDESKTSAGPCLNLAWDESVTVPRVCMKSFRGKRPTPPVWRHEVFFENRQARHPYHDLDKLTQRDFLRVSNDLLTLGISTNCQCLSILRTKFLDPMVDTNTNDRTLLCSIESTAHSRPHPGMKKLLLHRIIQPCYTKGSSAT